MSRKKIIAWRFKCAAKKLHDLSFKRVMHELYVRYELHQTRHGAPISSAWGLMHAVDTGRKRGKRYDGRR